MHDIESSLAETLDQTSARDTGRTEPPPQPERGSERTAVTAPEDRPLNLSQFDGPAFLMAAPLSFDTQVANNAWMEDQSAEQRVVRPRKAMRQFQVLYNFIASRSLVSLVAMPSNSALQDLVFTANMGIVLNHLPDNNTVVISNFNSEPRYGEMDVGMHYFKGMGYRTYIPRAKFEGEAELKHLHDNVYVGGYGIRSEKEAFEEMESQFDMKVIKVREMDPYLYHLDCSVFPLTDEKTIVCTEVFTNEEVAEMEKHTEIIPVGRDVAVPGLCNSVRMGNHILNGSNLNDLRPGSEEYAIEINKNRRLEDICAENGFEVAFFNLSEYIKGGGALSCMVMHLNRHSYGFRLI